MNQISFSQNNLYFTSNINLVGWLKLEKINYVKKEKSGNKYIFYFDDNENLRNEIIKFKQDGRMKEYLWILKRLKSELHHE